MAVYCRLWLLALTGTTSWIGGNRILSGALPVEELQKAIAAARNT